MESIIEKIQARLKPGTLIQTGKAIEPFLKGFRGTTGTAIAAVYPESLSDLYKLIQVCRSFKTGYLLQGANTALKGQGTPHEETMPVILIKTSKLKQIKVLDYPGTDEYKILLVQPGISLKETESVLSPLGYDLPHKIGSHDLGNTFGGSCAVGCGGVRVDNRDGRASLTVKGNMGVISLSAEEVIYNGFIRPETIKSGQELLEKIDENKIRIEDIDLPRVDEIEQFLKQLFIEKKYPIRNHRGDTLFAGDGAEGTQAILYLMYLVRKKPNKIQTYAFLCKDKDLKEHLYKHVIFSIDSTEELPILCESMNRELVSTIVSQGVCYISAFCLAVGSKWIAKHAQKVLAFRNRCIRIFSSLYLRAESFLGRCLSRCFTPKPLKELVFSEMVLVQIAERSHETQYIPAFEERLRHFFQNYQSSIELLPIVPGSFSEKLILQIRNVSALATYTVALMQKGTLFAFDDAIMPGKMTQKYCDALFTELSKKFPGLTMAPLLYGHDLKQISHNDWVIKKHLSEEEAHEVHQTQLQIIHEVGGFAHAEHGVGDYSDTDLNREELVKLVAHYLVNDPTRIANPGGGPERAFQKAIQDPALVQQAVEFAKKAIEKQLDRGTLLLWEETPIHEIEAKLKANMTIAFKKVY